MTRRAPILLTAVLAALVASWVWWIRGGEPAVVARQEAPVLPETQPSPPLTGIDAADTSDAVTRESAVAAESDTLAEGATATGEDKQTATLSVRATDAVFGEAIPRVRMYVMPQPLGSSWSSAHVGGNKGTPNTSPISGRDGTVEFELPAGVEFKLTATPELANAGTVSRDITALLPGERYEITLKLPTGFDLLYCGQVLSREDMKPIAGAIVTPGQGGRSRSWSAPRESRSDAASPRLDAQTTDAQGRFELRGASWMRLDARVDASGYAPYFMAVVEGHESHQVAKVVLMSRSASLLARLVDGGGGSVADGTVRLWTESYYIGEDDEGQSFGGEDPEWKGSADATGLCCIEGLPPDIPLHVEISRGGNVVKKDIPTVSLNPGEVREVEWRIGSGCHLRGSVADQDGTPVGRHGIWLQRADSDSPRIFQRHHSGEVILKQRSDSDGRFSFSDVSPGRWWIGPAAEHDENSAIDADGIAAFAVVIEILDGTTEQDVALRAHRGLYIRGVVFDPDAKPKDETYVYAHTRDVYWMMDARTGADGKFTIGPLIPGSYSLVAHGWELVDSEPVEAKGGDEGVVLRLRTGGSIHGTVVDKATGKACRAEISYSVQDPSDRRIGTTESQDDGTFDFMGMEPGTYGLAAKASGQRVGLLRGITVKAGTETRDLVLTVEPGATLRLRYAGEAGYLHYRIRSGGIAVAGDGIPAGGNVEESVPAGMADIEVWWPEKKHEERTIEVSIGERKELVFGGS
ncbi:MAG: collagen binding domain-containing protein [Planctomycetota bacterium]